jgi:hypothetical protein
MYAAGAAHPYRDACQWIMSQIAQGLLPVVIDVEIIRTDPITLYQRAQASPP